MDSLNSYKQIIVHYKSGTINNNKNEYKKIGE